MTWIEERLAELRDEAEVNLDRSMFAPHPDGYTCRCGIVKSCVCPSTWPDLVAAEQGAARRELHEKLQKLADRWEAASFGNIKKSYDACEYAEKMALRDCAHQLAKIIGSPDRITEE
jgi:hypothetical protein